MGTNYPSILSGFAGTSFFAASLLDFLIGIQHIPSFVITQADKPAGRGKKLTPSEVKKLALKYNIPCFTPNKINTEFIQKVKNINPNIIIVVEYGKLLPQDFIQIPKYGIINIHTSLLPRWRGAAPIARAIEAGDKETGISIMKVIPELDAGPVLIQKRCHIENSDTTNSLGKKLNNLAREGLKEYLNNLNNIKLKEQDHTKVTYAAKITKEESKINWQEDAKIIERKIRAFNPKPGCYALLGGQRIKIWLAQSQTRQDNPNISENIVGKICKNNKLGANEVKVICGKGILNIIQLQFEGRNSVKVADITGKSLLDDINIFD